MDILKVIACLMDYPTEEVARYTEDMSHLISRAKELSPDHRARLVQTLNDIYSGDLMDAQERYTGLYEQGRSLSLHIFEHVHGESRDRGQAMVDLMAEYDKNGFEIDSRELPDYIPMFLEYLSHRPDMEAREWLADVSHILALIGARLTERESSYANLFEALLLIAGRGEELQAKLAQVVGEEPDNTPEALDKEWEEIAVTFGAEEQSCGVKTSPKDNNIEQPIRWTDASGSDTQMPGGQGL